jgi:hypothetical protein
MGSGKGTLDVSRNAIVDRCDLPHTHISWKFADARPTFKRSPIYRAVDHLFQGRYNAILWNRSARSGL